MSELVIKPTKEARDYLLGYESGKKEGAKQELEKFEKEFSILREIDGDCFRKYLLERLVELSKE